MDYTEKTTSSGLQVCITSIPLAWYIYQLATVLMKAESKLIYTHMHLHTHTHTHTHAHWHRHTHTHTQTHAHTCTHMHTHAHAHGHRHTHTHAPVTDWGSRPLPLMTLWGPWASAMVIRRLRSWMSVNFWRSWSPLLMWAVLMWFSPVFWAPRPRPSLIPTCKQTQTCSHENILNYSYYIYMYLISR